MFNGLSRTSSFTCIVNASLDENSNLCLTNPCEKKKKKKKDSKVVIPVVASIGGFLVLLLAAVAIFWGFKRRKQGIYVLS